jgi:hypothetical protein
MYHATTPGDKGPVGAMPQTTQDKKDKDIKSNIAIVKLYCPQGVCTNNHETIRIRFYASVAKSR